MAYIKATLKSSGDKSSPYFRPFWIVKIPDKCLPIRTLLYVSFKHILIKLTSFMGNPNTKKILYKTSLFAESRAFMKFMNSRRNVSL
jgi:hypothetical protein